MDAAPAAAAEGQNQVVVADNPLAAETGLNILQAGGTATDAAIAVMLVLGLAEPEAAGIGGGAFLLHYSAATKRVDAYDGLIAAPAGIDSRLFLDGSGAPLSYGDAAVGGRAVGVPGLLRLAKLAHLDHGRLPWAALFEPAIALAEQGVPVSARLHDAIAADKALSSRPAAAGLFYRHSGQAIGRGDRLRNHAYAEALRQVAAGGPTSFYSGAIAQRIVSTVRGDLENPGFMTLQDLAGYRAKRRLALCVPYRIWRICGAPPPASGGLGVLQVMTILSRFDLAALPPMSPAALHLITEASRLAAADLALFLADPDHTQVPLQQLLDPAYLHRRADLIAADRSLAEATAGVASERFAAMPDQPGSPAATHVAVVDQWGNAVALSASLQGDFGSRLLVDGFLLNSGLTGFAFTPSVAGRPVANRLQGGKRPRSPMAPIMVLDRQGRMILTGGSSGGARAVDYVVLTLVAALDWRLAPDKAIALPHVANADGVTVLESRRGLEAAAAELRAQGHNTAIATMESGLNVIGRSGDDRWIGAADPRGAGTAQAD